MLHGAVSFFRRDTLAPSPIPVVDPPPSTQMKRSGHVMARMPWVMMLSLAIMILYNGWICHYVTRLERIGCPCAMDWRRTYIQVFTGVSVVVSGIYLMALLSSHVGAMRVTHALTAPFMALGAFLMVVFVLQYVHRLKKEKCLCSQSFAREVMYIFAIINAIVYALMGLLIITVLLMTGYARAVHSR
jgi:hypothetical protein